MAYERIKKMIDEFNKSIRSFRLAIYLCSATMIISCIIWALLATAIIPLVVETAITNYFAENYEIDQ